MAVVAIAILFAVYSSIESRDKTSGIGVIKKTESQKIINDNIDLLHKRWERIEAEYNSGTLKTVSEWYFDNATYDQISQVKELGINLGTLKLTKGQASDIIGLFEPPEKKNAAMLQNQSITPSRMNKTEAREFMLNSRNDLVESHYGIVHLTKSKVTLHLYQGHLFRSRSW